MADRSEMPDVVQTAVVLAERTRELQRELEDFVSTYLLWMPMRKESVSAIRDTAKRIDKHHKNANISNVVGGSVAVVGGGMAVAGIGLAPITMGLSTVLTGAGIGLGVVGGATGAGATITDHVLRKKNKDRALEMLHSDRDQTNALVKIIGNIQRLTDEIETAAIFIQEHHKAQLRMYGAAKTSHASKTCESDAVAEVTSIEDAFALIITILPEYLSMVPLSAFRVRPQQILGALSWLSRTYRNTQFIQVFRGILQNGARVVASRAFLAGAGGVLIGIGIALELVNIAVTAVDIHRGSKTKTARELLTSANELEKELAKVEVVFNEIMDVCDYQ